MDASLYANRAIERWQRVPFVSGDPDMIHCQRSVRQLRSIAQMLGRKCRMLCLIRHVNGIS